jgi:alkanesulfonate monooxygenase SsuD/methylene tetrahydromethanopterin reductase-like flavin-dependent oxidoreductase (luciferase family)
MKRAATLGDGWHPNGLPPTDYRAGVEQIKAIAASAGRDPDQIFLSVRANIRLNPPAGATPSRFDGSSQDIVDGIGAYAEEGVEHVVLAPDSGDVPRLRDKFEQIARDVLPAFR